MDLRVAWTNRMCVHATGDNARKEGADDDGNEDDDDLHGSPGPALTHDAGSGQSRAVRGWHQDRGAELVRLLH